MAISWRRRRFRDQDEWHAASIVLLTFLVGLIVWALLQWGGWTATTVIHQGSYAIPALGLRLSQGEEAAHAFVAARIGNVMAFEKWKAGVKPMEKARDFARALGRMRYGAGVEPPPPEA